MQWDDHPVIQVCAILGFDRGQSISKDKSKHIIDREITSCERRIKKLNIICAKQVNPQYWEVCYPFDVDQG